MIVVRVLNGIGCIGSLLLAHDAYVCAVHRVAVAPLTAGCFVGLSIGAGIEMFVKTFEARK